MVVSFKEHQSHVKGRGVDSRIHRSYLMLKKRTYYSVVMAGLLIAGKNERGAANLVDRCRRRTEAPMREREKMDGTRKMQGT